MLLSAVVLSVIGASLVNDLPREFRAAWVATVDNIDWPSARNLTRDQQQAELVAIVDRAKAMNLNALVFQVRPSCDALYKSDIEPWSEYLTGEQGKDPGWDPLSFMIDRCHRAGLELHAWFNPYRSWHPAAKGKPAANYIGKTNPGLAKKYGKYEWLDPGEPAVQDRSFNVFMDVVKRYDVDGIHIDDYFYPYPEKDAAGKPIDFPDQPSFDAYARSGGQLGRSDWRRKNVDDFVSRIYKGTKALKPWVKFGISPFGIYRPGIPAGIAAGIDQYEALYADARKWLVEGWCDYFTPQLYWPITQKPQSYPVLLDWWASQNKKGRHLWPGNYTSRLGESNAKGWSTEELIDQIRVTRDQPGAGGNVHFSMKAFSRDYAGVVGKLVAGPYRGRAIVPSSSWLANGAVPKPTVTIANGRAEVVAKAGAPWIVAFDGTTVIGTGFDRATFEALPGCSYVAFDRAWRASAVVTPEVK